MQSKLLFLSSLSMSLGLCSNAYAQEKPNILIILADDAGYSDFGFMGSTDTKTPNIDALAREGRVFSDAHVAATVSSPSRAMLMTGRYGQRFGYECNTEAGQGMPEGEELLPELLKREGYRTACIGKWHLGTYDFQHPNAQGFDEFYGLIGGSRSYFYDKERDDNPKSDSRYQHNGVDLEFDGYFTDELTARAKEIISKGDEPFMMYLSYTAPHSPNHATQEDLALFEGERRQTYAAMLWALDRGVGEVIAELKRTGKYDNTIIFFTSDNGGATTNNSSNLPLKGFKGNKFEGGHRVPFIASWGDRWTCEERFTGLSSSFDIYATIVDILGVSKKDLHKPIDGVSLEPYLTKKIDGAAHDVLYWRKMDSRAIRYKDYKLIMTTGVDTVMYNIKNDISETTDIIEKEPKIAKKMIKKLAKWEDEECVNPLWIEEGWAPITNGYHRRLMNNEITTADDLKKSK